MRERVKTTMKHSWYKISNKEWLKINQAWKNGELKGHLRHIMYKTNGIHKGKIKYITLLATKLK